MTTTHKRRAAVPRCSSCGTPHYLPSLVDVRRCWRCAIIPPDAPPAPKRKAQS